MRGLGLVQSGQGFWVLEFLGGYGLKFRGPGLGDLEE